MDSGRIAREEIETLRWRLQQTEQDRDRYRHALQALLKEARLHADQSKHLQRECEDAEKALEGKE